MSEAAKPGRPRMTAGRWGAIVGFCVIVAPVAALGIWIGPQIDRPPFNVEVMSSGADVSRNGGAKVIVRNEQGEILQQICRDGCDDFQLQAVSSDDVVGVQVFDGQGRAVTPLQPMTYVTSGVLTRFAVTDAGGLKVRESYIHRNPDGTSVETLEPLPVGRDRPGDTAERRNR